MFKLASCPLILILFNIAWGDDMVDLHFVTDLIAEHQLQMPTAIFQEGIPDICMTNTRIHCISSENMDYGAVIEHVFQLHNKGRQDALIIVGGGGAHRKLLTGLAKLYPVLLTSNYPVFVPLEYSNEISLRLDSHIIFYEVEPNGVRLTDKFAVKGGTPISLDLGRWTTLNGFRYKTWKNRWDRRRDLKGASMVYALFNPTPTTLIKDEQGNIIGSRGFYPETLLVMTENLNMTTKTVVLPPGRWTKLENGTWTGGVGFLQSRSGDVCLSVGITLDRDILLELGRVNIASILLEGKNLPPITLDLECSNWAAGSRIVNMYLQTEFPGKQ